MSDPFGPPARLQKKLRLHFRRSRTKSTAHLNLLHLGVDGAPSFRRNRTMIRALMDDRFRRVCAILAGMAAMAVTVVVITIVIHDRMQ